MTEKINTSDIQVKSFPCVGCGKELAVTGYICKGQVFRCTPCVHKLLESFDSEGLVSED